MLLVSPVCRWLILPVHHTYTPVTGSPHSPHVHFNCSLYLWVLPVHDSFLPPHLCNWCSVKDSIPLNSSEHNVTLIIISPLVGLCDFILLLWWWLLMLANQCDVQQQDFVAVGTTVLVCNVHRFVLSHRALGVLSLSNRLSRVECDCD